MKRIYFLFTVLLLICSSAFSSPVKTEGDAIKMAIAAIHHFHLTTLKDECGSVGVSEESTFFQVELRERHTKACGGDPETSPRLFSIRVRKRDGRLTSDVYDGTNYRALDHSLKKKYSMTF
jgi:hypothetical protein